MHVQCAQDSQRGSSTGAERSDTGPTVIEVSKFSSYLLTRRINIADTPHVPLGHPHGPTRRRDQYRIKERNALQEQLSQQRRAPEQVQLARAQGARPS